MSDPITNFFDNMADERNRVMAENAIVEYEQERRSAGVLSFLDPQAGELILDVGCGNARDIIPILKKGSRIVGIDLSPRMISEAHSELSRHSLSGYELEVGDATKLRFPDSYFDKVIASEVIEHIPDWHAALQEMFRVLKQKGCLVLSTPNRKSWYGFDRYIVYEKMLRRKWDHPCDQWKTYRELEAALASSGFSIIEKRGICYVPGFIIPYFVFPRSLKRSLIKLVRKIEKRLSHSLPTNGYVLCIKAIKT
jgi:ubiquinone/menaquinone biosynthesis C-methylase UbiE